MTSIKRAWLDRLRTFAGRCSRGIFAAVMVSATSPTPGASGGGVLHEGRDEACTPWARPALVDDAARRLSLNHVLSAVLDEAIEPVRIGRFILLERLGAGGMGIVYSAYDPQLDRRVAVKLLRADRATHADDPADRLLREAQAMARLSHPNVVAVHEVGVHEGAIFVAMEFIEGTTLAAWLGTPRSPAEIVEAFLAAGRGLAAAHAAGLVHRDFKPKSRRPSQTAPQPTDRPHSQELGRFERVSLLLLAPRCPALPQVLAKRWQRLGAHARVLLDLVAHQEVAAMCADHANRSTSRRRVGTGCSPAVVAHNHVARAIQAIVPSLFSIRATASAAAAHCSVSSTSSNFAVWNMSATSFAESGSGPDNDRNSLST
jgi:hypothetical protein